MKNLFIVCLLILSLFYGCRKENNKPISIAILTPVTHPSLEQIEQGFVKTMEEQHPGKYHFVTFNAQGNKTLMRSEIEEIARQNFALIFTLGASASQMTREVLSKKGLSTPIVFTCVNDPIGFHIVSSEQTPGGNVTGVKEMLNFKEELAALLNFKPQTKQILLVYNPAEPGLQKDQQEIERILKEMGIGLTSVETFQTNEIKAKVSPFLETSDAILVLKDNTVVAGLDVLVKLCDAYQIPLMASDLDSPDRGAAFGYGVHEVDFGKEAAKKALLILNQGTTPGAIPVTPVSEFSLRVNAEAAKRQGIDPFLIPADKKE